MERGAFREAFTLIVDEPVNRPDDLFAKIGVLADAGVALRDESALQYGLYLLERHAEEILAVPNYAPFHWFNLGNLRVDLAALREAEGELFRDVAAAHHQAHRFRRMDDGSTAVIKAPMEHHMDGDMESLADRINVPIVWGEIPEY